MCHCLGGGERRATTNSFKKNYKIEEARMSYCITR